jgi:hypothetical protein
MNDGAKVDAFGGDEGKSLREIEPQLCAKDAPGAGSGAVAFDSAVCMNMPEKLFVLVHAFKVGA